MLRHTFLHAILWLSTAAALDAQVVRGRIVDRATMQPIPTTGVTAVTVGGRRIGRTMSDSAGAFSLELRNAGAYRLEAQRIGYQAVTSPGFGRGVIWSRRQA
jgi:hypothetical protein